VGLSDFEPVALASGEWTLRDRRSGELMHPGLGPRREAELLYVEQTRLADRLSGPDEAPVRVLDVGLGAATNALAVVDCAIRVKGRALHLTSLEQDDGPLRLALAEPSRFLLQAAHRLQLESLLVRRSVEAPGLRWTWLQQDALAALDGLDGRQDVICFDPFSPEANPALWTVEALGRFRQVLAPGGVLSTFSASTRTRVTLLLAGFWVGTGAAAAVKETTVASDGPAALSRPLGQRWLERWSRSSARAPHGSTLDAATEARIRAHPQFADPEGVATFQSTPMGGSMMEPTAQVSKVMGATAAEIWTALTTPKLMKTYFLGADISSDFRVGSPITFRGQFKGKPYEDKGEIKTVEPQKRLSFSHFSPMTGQPDVPENYHTVTFDLEPAESGTKVTLTQANLVGGVKPSDRKQRAEFERNWMSVLDGLKKMVETR
jgi:uncharacterized protein YndB with AHSA1/START domain/tRNA U34 5-methylaminomethyl-2-thiouridine-forming methyltransferase MnmC